MEISLYLLNALAVVVIAFMSLKDEQAGRDTPRKNPFRPLETNEVSAGKPQGRSKADRASWTRIR